jgi:PqqD family protein of HPr-rel-A system
VIADDREGHLAPHRRFACTAGLRVHDFGDLCAVFDPLSWDAHLLNPAAVAVIDLLAETPHSVLEVEAFLTQALHPEERGMAHNHAQALLAELSSLGLIRPLDEPDRALR